MGGAYRSEGGGWLERFREWSGRDSFQVPSEAESLDAAHDAGPLDAATIFAYFDGRLTPEECSAVEREAAASPAALRKLTRLAALSVRNSPVIETGRPTSPTPVVRVCLWPPQDVDTPQAALDRPELAQRVDTDPDLELRRFRCQGVDLVRADHAAWPVGTLLRIELSGEPAGPATTFAVMRSASQNGTAACFLVPLAFDGRPVDAVIRPVGAGDLTDADAAPLGRAFDEAQQADPRSRSTFDAPLSAWESCAERLIDAGSGHDLITAPAVLEVAETVLGHRSH